jgi:hypothetical protein
MSGLAILLLSVLQQTPTITCKVRAHDAPLPDAEVVVAGHTYETAASGEVRVFVEPGTVVMTVTKEGFVPVTTTSSTWSGCRASRSRSRFPRREQGRPSKTNRCVWRCSIARSSKKNRLRPQET